MTPFEFYAMMNDPYNEFLTNYCTLYMQLFNERMIEDRNAHDLYMHQRAFNNYKFYDV
jgi:hypothetical protein